jgi:hypothetical protein
MLGHVCEVVDQDGAAVSTQVLDVTSVERGVIFHEIVMRSGDRDEEIENVDAGTAHTFTVENFQHYVFRIYLMKYKLCRGEIIFSF